jgi:hypothetical protein
MLECSVPPEKEVQRIICTGEDLLDRTHEVAQSILERVHRAMDVGPVPGAHVAADDGESTTLESTTDPPAAPIGRHGEPVV